eukprot:evm.model.scf_910.1 EVM.evm.TU.scf_910.1   scf_910:24458-29165(-)
MLTYYLTMEPQLFKTAVEDQLSKLKLEKEAKEAAASGDASTEENANKSDLVLYRRMEEVRESEKRSTLEDLMYISILEKFVVLNVDMLPRMEDDIDVSDIDLSVLTEGIHSKEAIELVKEHVLGVMGPAAMAYSSSQLKTSKLQMAQVYAASVMFGYFLRRVDKRFQLESAVGGFSVKDTESESQPESLERSSDVQDAARKLEELFKKADNMESVDDPDVVFSPSSGQESTSTGATSSAGAEGDISFQQPGSKAEGKPTLRQYVESFDQDTMIETAKIVSVEGAALVERQTAALFGDLKALQKEMQEAVGPNVLSVEDLLKKIQQAVMDGKVSTLTMTVGTQRRTVLEAVAFGTFLRDVETWVQSDYGLLTALPAPRPEDFGPGPPPL